MCMCEYFYGKYADVCINTTNETKHELSRKSLNEKSKMRERERKKTHRGICEDRRNWFLRVLERERERSEKEEKKVGRGGRKGRNKVSV